MGGNLITLDQIMDRIRRSQGRHENGSRNYQRKKGYKKAKCAVFGLSLGGQPQQPLTTAWLRSRGLHKLIAEAIDGLGIQADVMITLWAVRSLLIITLIPATSGSHGRAWLGVSRAEENAVIYIPG